MIRFTEMMRRWDGEFLFRFGTDDFLTDLSGIVATYYPNFPHGTVVRGFDINGKFYGGYVSVHEKKNWNEHEQNFHDQKMQEWGLPILSGQWVVRKNVPGVPEIGRVKSCNCEYIFVVYHCSDQWDDFKHYTAAATRPEELVFVYA